MGGGAVPLRASRECPGIFAYNRDGGVGPRSSTCINSLKERRTEQREEARVLEPTVPTKDLTPSCRICKRRFPLSPEAEGGGRSHSELCPLGILMGGFLTTEFTKDPQPQGPLRECPLHCTQFTKNMQTQGCILRNKHINKQGNII